MPKVNDTTHAWVQTQAKLSTPDEGFSLLLFDLFEKKFRKVIKPKQFFFLLVMPYTHLMGLIVMKKQVTTTIKLISKPRSAWDFWMMITRNGAWRCIFSVKMHAAFCWRFLVHHSKAGASSFTFVMPWWLLQQQLFSSLNFTDAMRYFPIFPRVYWSGPQPVGLIVSWRQY